MYCTNISEFPLIIQHFEKQLVYNICTVQESKVQNVQSTFKSLINHTWDKSTVG